MNYRQIARFSIDDRKVRHNPDEIAQIFSLLKLVPVRAEAMFHKWSIDYVAVSERFSHVTEGEVPPEVEFVVTKDSTGNVTEVEVVYI